MLIKDLINPNYTLEIDSVPLRIWTADWPLPKNVKLKSYILNLNTSHKTNVNLNRYALWGEVENIKDFRKRTYKDKKPTQWGKGKKSGRRFDYTEIEKKVWIKILSKCSPLSIKSRKFSFDGKYLRMSLLPKEVALWYLSGEGQVRFIVLPESINLKEEFFELIGFLDGEMCKTKVHTGGSSIKISNSEITIIKQILKSFKEFFNIPIESWTASLTLNNKNSKFAEEEDYLLKKYWSEDTGINIKDFTKTTIQSKYNSLFSDKGIVQIRYSDNLFFQTLLDIMTNVRKTIIQNKEYSTAYMRGVVAGEGGIGKRGDKLRMVHIGSTDEENKTFYAKCLKNMGITSIQTYKLRVEICGLKNFIILRNVDIFRYIPYRKEKFIVALRNLEDSYKQRINQS